MQVAHQLLYCAHMRQVPRGEVGEHLGQLRERLLKRHLPVCTKHVAPGKHTVEQVLGGPGQLCQRLGMHQPACAL